jgi:hypothetical protein
VSRLALDISAEASPESAPRVMQAIAAFGAPAGEFSEVDFAREGVPYQIGVLTTGVDDPLLARDDEAISAASRSSRTGFRRLAAST